MEQKIEVCWTCSNLSGGRCPIRKEVKKFNKIKSIETVITECKDYKKIKT